MFLIQRKDDDSKDVEIPLFSNTSFTMYIGWDTFMSCGSHNLQLLPSAVKHWNILMKPAAKKLFAKLPKLKIPGRKMPAK